MIDKVQIFNASLNSSKKKKWGVIKNKKNNHLQYAE